MLKIFLATVTAAAFFAANSAQAATMTLKPSDLDTNPAAIQQAMNQLQPGDTLYLAGGSYTPTGGIPSYNDNTLDIRPTDGRGRSGTANKWITVRNVANEKPILNLGKNNKGGMAIVDVSYWRIEGLELVATSDASSYATGLSTVSTSNGSAHHIQFANNIIHGFGASGLSANNASQILVEGNTIYDNAHRSSNGASGISLGGLKMKSDDNTNFGGTLGNPNNDYAMILRNNRVYFNRNLHPDTDHGSKDLSDGNGIIIDYCDETGFTGKTLVSNNVVYNNAGAGVHVFKSSNVDVFHNTAYQNAWLSNGTQLSNFGPLNSSGVTRINRFFNNIAVGGNPNIQNGTFINGGKTSGANRGWQGGAGYVVSAQWDKNLFYGTSDTKFPSGSITGSDPKFVKAQLDTTSAPVADFHLSPASGAINIGAASSATNVATDHDSKTRDSKPDIGAYEFISNKVTKMSSDAASASSSTVTPGAPVTKPTLNQADGTFETVAGWRGIDGAKSIVEEKGNHFLRIKNDKPEDSVYVGGRFALDPTWKRIAVSAKLRGTIVAKGKENWNAPRLGFQFQNAEEKMVGGWPAVLSLDATRAEWITVSRTYDVPAGASSILMGPGLWGTSGTFDIDDLTVTSGDVVVEKAPAPANQLRLLTLGDSITAIFRYQASLRESLKAEGIEAEFVGSGGEGEKKHEGHSGWSIGAIEDNVTKYISDSNANVVLLQIGVNNMHTGLGAKGKEYPPYQDGVYGQGARPGKTLDELGASWGAPNYGSGYLTDRVNGLLDKILSHPNAPLLVVAKVPGIGLGNPLWKTENDQADARVREFNSILETAVKARQAKGQKLEIVDNYALGNRAYGTGPEFTWGTQEQQSGDWVHPRAESAAWKGMATNFAEGLKRLRKR